MEFKRKKNQYYEQTPYEAFFYIDIFFVNQVLITYQSINQSINPVYEEGSRYTTAEAKLQSRIVCVRILTV
jgi:hypothetical protein